MHQDNSNVCRRAYLELDYSNSILAGLPLKQISRLRRVQNNAAKLFLGKSKYDHVTPLLQEQHWLPIKFRLQCRIANFVYRFFDGSQRDYLSQTHHLLKIPERNTKRTGSVVSAFLHLLSGTLCHPISEILLPFRFFKSRLKTSLFTIAFCQQEFWSLQHPPPAPDPLPLGKHT